MIDPRSIDLGPHAEDAWLRLRHHLGWSQGFALGFLFVANPRLAAAFRWRLERAYRGRVSTLQTLKPASPDVAIDEIMHLVRESPALLDDMAAPLWIELHEHAGDEAWDRARTLVLARLNEHRELLRRRLGRPLILILPQGWQTQARQIAPDLWFIRDFSLEVAAAATSMTDQFPQLEKSPAIEGEYLSRFSNHSLVNEWGRLKGNKDFDKPDALLNALITGWRAIDFLLDQRRIDDAYAIANEILALTRQGSESDPRVLGISLSKVGDAARALGRLEEAERVYAESLAVMRDLRQRLGDIPEVLCDLSVALDRVGDAARALGRVEEAERAYAESLAVMRDLRQRLGDTPKVLRDLSIALNNMGDTAHALGQLEEVERVYAESLAVMRNLRQHLGDTPEVLRDLSVALDRVGDAARALGRLEEAERAYTESLAVRRVLRQRLDDTPEKLRDLSVSLSKVGDAASALGRLEEAERAYAESLVVSRALHQRLGDTPEVLRDLSILLNKVGNAASALGRLEEARNAYQEAATLLRRLDHVFPGQEYASWLTDVEAKYQTTASTQAQGSGDCPS